MGRFVAAGLLAAAAAVMAACGGGGAEVETATGTVTETAEAAPAQAGSQLAEEPQREAPRTEVASGEPPVRFEVTVAAIDEATRAGMSWSWRPGCPVPIEELRLLTLDHWGFDGAVHRGELVVHEDQADAVALAMRMLFEGGFPIARMELVDVYEGDDERSMAANNTSAFNCRRVGGRSGVWSEHAYGRAIDINPIENFSVSRSGDVSPAAGAEHVDRAGALGMIHADDLVVQTFAAIGWDWGGSWASSKDYQHFSATGR